MTGERESTGLDLEEIFSTCPELFSLTPGLRAKDKSAEFPDLITEPYTDAGFKGGGDEPFDWGDEDEFLPKSSGAGEGADTQIGTNWLEDLDFGLDVEVVEQVKKSKLSPDQKKLLMGLGGGLLGAGLNIGLELAGVDFQARKIIGIVASSAWFSTAAWASTKAAVAASRAESHSRKEKVLLGIRDFFYNMTVGWKGLLGAVVVGYNSVLAVESITGNTGPLAKAVKNIHENARQAALEAEATVASHLQQDSGETLVPSPTATVSETPFPTPTHSAPTHTPFPTSTHTATHTHTPEPSAAPAHTVQGGEVLPAQGADNSGELGGLPKVDAGQAGWGKATQVSGSAGFGNLVPDEGISGDVPVQPEPAKTVVNPAEFKPRFGHVLAFTGKPEANDVAEARQMHGKPEWFAAHRQAVPIELPRDAGEYVVQPGQTMSDLAQGLARNQGGSMFENLLKLFRANQDYLLSNSNPNRDLAQAVINNLPESGDVDFQEKIGDASLAQLLMRSMNFVRSGQVISLP